MSERAKGVPAMADDCLLAIVMSGDDEPDWEPCEDELTARAEGGSLPCQRGVFGLLHILWLNDRMSDQMFIERAEPIARLAAAQGDHRDISRLAATLAIRAAWLRKSGAADLADDDAVEALVMIGEIAHDSPDPAVVSLAAGDFLALAHDFSEVAVLEARTELQRRDCAKFDQKAEPEVLEAVDRRASSIQGGS